MINKHHAPLQFFKDGLPGAIIVALLYLPLWWAAPLPGVFFMTTIFIGTGLSTRFIKHNIPTRKDWAKPILKMLGITWLVTLVITPLYVILRSIIGSLFKLAEHHNFHHSLSQAFFAVYDAVAEGFSSLIPSPILNLYYLYSFCYFYIVGSIIGLLVGFIITYLAAVLFYSQKQWTYMFIPIIANFSFIISICFSTGIFYMMGFGYY